MVGLSDKRVTDGRIKPGALKSGDTVGVVAPAAAIEPEFLERGVNALAALGLRVKVSKHALSRNGILAGDDRERAGELAAYFADPEIKAIFAARGGYGSGRLLPILDFDAIARTPKIFVGFSDVTFLLNALVQRSRMVCFHGPMAGPAYGLSPRSLDHLIRLLKGETRVFEMDARDVVRPGVAEGEVIGGCLSVVVAMLGTPWVPDFRRKILFLEDTGEKAYRIDRMLVQLRQSGTFEQVAGIVFGGLPAPDGSYQERQLISQFIAEQTADLGCPVLCGLEAGHGTENLAIPFGRPAGLDSRTMKLSFAEAAVS
jgi:muramoyltetrapeptide carboxypeptidase